MNWYRKTKLATNSIKFPDDMEEQIDAASRSVVDYYFSNSQEVIYQGSFTYVNPYGKKGKPIPILAHPYTPDRSLEIASFNPQYRNINVFPYHHTVEDVSSEKLFNYLKPFIYHEVAHAIDPKYFIPDWWRGRENIPYYEKEEEFDAYSKQMEFVIQSNLNENNIKEFKKWITSPLVLLVPPYLSYFQNAIAEWSKYKPEYIKLLRQRLYNAFIKDNKYAVPKTHT